MRVHESKWLNELVKPAFPRTSRVKAKVPSKPEIISWHLCRPWCQQANINFGGGGEEKDGKGKRLLLQIPELRFEDKHNETSPFHEGTCGLSHPFEGRDLSTSDGCGMTQKPRTAKDRAWHWPGDTLNTKTLLLLPFLSDQFQDLVTLPPCAWIVLGGGTLTLLALQVLQPGAELLH